MGAATAPREAAWRGCQPTGNQLVGRTAISWPGRNRNTAALEAGRGERRVGQGRGAGGCSRDRCGARDVEPGRQAAHCAGPSVVRPSWRALTRQGREQALRRERAKPSRAGLDPPEAWKAARGAVRQGGVHRRGWASSGPLPGFHACPGAGLGKGLGGGSLLWGQVEGVAARGAVPATPPAPRGRSAQWAGPARRRAR